MSGRPAPATELWTPRLHLRRWRDDDRSPFAAMNADPSVMELFPSTMTRAESDALVDRIEGSFQDQGLGLWAVEVRDIAMFAGFVGLLRPTFEAAFTPAVEVGWRLAAETWGRGFATEAAGASLIDGFDRLGLEEIVSFTWEGNERSRRVMAKLGMTHDPADDFDHPRVPEGHRIRRHVLYRKSAPLADLNPGRGAQ
ncbi:MAG: GNAT family N-acetyltransferase [Acidimicrobiales bacterium]